MAYGKIANFLFVDDHPLVLEGLGTLIAERFKNCQISVCHGTDEVLERLGQETFDLIVLDILLPGRCVFELAEKIVQRGLGKVVFLSAFFNEINISRCLAAGALGLISKHESRDEVIRCIGGAVEGHRTVSKTLSSRFCIQDLLKQSPAVRLTPRLSHREIEILTYVAAGHSTKDIARLTALKVRTVDRHRSNIMDKTGLHDRLKLAKFAIKEGYTNG